LDASILPYGAPSRTTQSAPEPQKFTAPGKLFGESHIRTQKI